MMTMTDNLFGGPPPPPLPGSRGPLKDLVLPAGADATVVTVDSELSGSSENPVQNKAVKAALDGKATAAQGAKADAALSRAEAEAGFTEWTVKRDGADVTAQVAQPSYDSTEGAWYVEASALPSDSSDIYHGASQDATGLTWDATDGVSNIVYTATRTRLPTMANLAGKADKSEMTVTPGSGANADKTTIQLKSGTSATVLTAHQQLTPVYSQTPTFSEWVFSDVRPTTGYSPSLEWGVYDTSQQWFTQLPAMGNNIGIGGTINQLQISYSRELEGIIFAFTATRTRTDIVGYTLGTQTDKPLQPKGDYQPTLTAAQIANIAAVPNKADAASLPYALVDMQLSAWMYSWPEGAVVSQFEAQYSNGAWIFDNPDNSPISVTAAEDAMSLTFTAFDVGGTSYTVTATRGCQLTDRAVNAVSLSAAATLTMPAAISGHARDFKVRMTLSASAAVTFAAPSGETITWDSSGDPSGTFAAGTHLYRITEVAAGVFHAEDMDALDGIEAALAAINGGVAS